MDMSFFILPSFGPIPTLLRLLAYIVPPLLFIRLRSQRSSPATPALSTLVALLPATLCGIGALWNAFVFCLNLASYAGPSPPLVWSGLSGSASVARFGIPGALVLLGVSALPLLPPRPATAAADSVSMAVPVLLSLVFAVVLAAPTASFAFPPSAILSAAPEAFLSGCRSFTILLVVLCSLLVAFTVFVVVLVFSPAWRGPLAVSPAGHGLLLLSALALLVLSWLVGGTPHRRALEPPAPVHGIVTPHSPGVG